MELSVEVSSLSVEPHGRNGVYATMEEWLVNEHSEYLVDQAYYD
jgi:hypothetical protein